MAKKRKKTPSRYIVAAVLIVAAAWMFAPLPSLLKSQDELTRVKLQLAKIKKQNKILEKQIINMKKDKYVEQAARQQLDLAMPDEETYIVVKADPPKKKPKKLEVKQHSILQPILDFFSGIFGAASK